MLDYWWRRFGYQKLVIVLLGNVDEGKWLDFGGKWVEVMWIVRFWDWKSCARPEWEDEIAKRWF